VASNLRASKHARFLYWCAPLAEDLGFETPSTRIHPLLSATTKVALPRDHERGREEDGFAGRADRCHVGRCFPRFVDIIYFLLSMFYTYKECHQTESLWNRITTDHKKEKLEDRRNVGEKSCNSGDVTDQRVQFLMFMMMMMMMMIYHLKGSNLLSLFRIFFKTTIYIPLLSKILKIKPYKTILHFSYDFYKL
jgi:hypothetical protein